MTSPSLTRRELLAASAAGTVLALGAAVPAPAAAQSEPAKPAARFGHCLNTSTIRGQKLGIVAEVEIAAKAGYTAVEPWIRELDEYVKGGGSLEDLGKRIKDLGLTVESAIGFAEWIVDDDAKRAKGLEEAKRNMEMLVKIGGKRLAAPPVGATNQTDLNLFKAAERYRALCELGEQQNITPQVEVWGFSKSLSRLGESMFVAIEAGHKRASLLADVYHIHKGGSDFLGLRQISGLSMQVFHVNDYPATPARPEIKDADRVFPGDGVAPLGEIFRGMRDVGFQGYLSLELFNPTYWQQDALTVCKTGLEKTKAALAKALEG